MFTRRIVAAIALTLGTATAVAAAPAALKWPPWISIESPVNPYDASARGATLLVHAIFREGTAKLTDVSGTAEGLVNGARRTIPLRFDTTSRPGVFALRKQWPAEGTWILRIGVASTTALVTFDGGGNASAHVPTETRGNARLPREVGAREIDSTLARIAAAVKR